MKFIDDLLARYGVSAGISGYLSGGVTALLIIMLCLSADFLAKRVVVKIVVRYKNKLTNIMHENKVFQRSAHLVPAIIINALAPAFGVFHGAVQKFAMVWIAVATAFVISAVLDSADGIYRTYPVSNVRPIKGLLQTAKIIVYIITGIAIIANLLDKSPLMLLSGIGALTAVFSLVFKDSILGLVAGIQLTSNDMLRIGDWIEMPKYGANGGIADISLTTVKVRNFDQSIVSIPAYALVSDSFKNWRGMDDSGARRIKRSVYIDINSIGFCTAEMIERLKKIPCLADYIAEKERNISNDVSPGLPAHRGRVTNIGAFREYLQKYLESHPQIRPDMPLTARQLPPGEHGLPLEIYAFANDTDWANFEDIQADIFDHVLAAATEFGLRIFQNPTGYDVKQIGRHAGGQVIQ